MRSADICRVNPIEGSWETGLQFVNVSLTGKGSLLSHRHHLGITHLQLPLEKFGLKVQLLESSHF